jgi:hypothetical protein
MVRIAKIFWNISIVYNISRHDYNIPTCSYNGENCKNIFKYFDSGYNYDDFKNAY